MQESAYNSQNAACAANLSSVGAAVAQSSLIGDSAVFSNGTLGRLIAEVEQGDLRGSIDRVISGISRIGGIGGLLVAVGVVGYRVWLA